MKRITLFALATACMVSVHAKIVLPDLVSDNMVLQQQANARLWGKAAPKSVIEVQCSWTGRTFRTTAQQDSTWLLTVATPKASFTPQTLTFTEKVGKQKGQ